MLVSPRLVHLMFCRIASWLSANINDHLHPKLTSNSRLNNHAWLNNTL